MAKGASIKKASSAKKTKVEISLLSIEIMSPPQINVPHNYDFIDLTPLTFKYDVNVRLIPDESIVRIEMAYYFRYKQETIFSVKLGNIFKIDKYDSVVRDGKLLQKHFLLSIIKQSTSHLHGVQAYSTMGTPLANLLAPYFDEDRLLNTVVLSHQKD